ncbi:MAG: DUF2572 family protein [Gammaproteobacteria bacterium]|nr:DUF2572 family protein [Gammaproteobacteria bacterium]
MAQRNQQNRTAPDQKGAYTLATVMFLLFILGLSSVFATQISVNEQRIARNSFHLLQAKQNAQSAYANIQRNLRWNDVKGLSIGDKSTLDLAEIMSTSGRSQGSASVNIWRRSTSTFQLEIEARSAPNFASYTLSQDFTFQQLFHSLPQQAIIARKDIRLSAMNNIGTLDNNTNTPLVWAGGPVATDLDNSVIRDNDSRLHALSSQELIQNFSHLDIDTLQFLTKKLSCDRTQCTNADIGATSIAYIDGNISIAQDLGTSTSPVILIINGQMELQNNATIHGVVIVMNDWSVTSQAGSIRGSIIVDGNLDIEGVVSFKYDQELLSTLNQNTSYFLPVVGAWHDF